MKTLIMILARRICWFIFLFLLVNTKTYALTSYDDQRYISLTKEIRCVVCQGQSIAESEAPLAKDLRQKIYTMIAAQQSDDDIKNYLTKRYGEFILLKPRFNLNTAVLWLFPFVALILATLGIGYLFSTRI